jgi:hypothetical protein
MIELISTDCTYLLALYSRILFLRIESKASSMASVVSFFKESSIMLSSAVSFKKLNKLVELDLLGYDLLLNPFFIFIWLY